MNMNHLTGSYMLGVFTMEENIMYTYVQYVLSKPVSFSSLFEICFYPAGIYLLKVNNRNTRTRCEICSKLTIKIPERVFLLLTLNM